MEPELMFTNGLEEYIKKYFKNVFISNRISRSTLFSVDVFFSDAFSCKK